MPDERTRPNILLVLTDQERQRDWIPDHLDLPNRRRLLDGGLEFTNYFTNSVPCSPARACLMTGQYLSQHGVTENVLHPNHTELSSTIPTLGSILRASGYQTSYMGKWHLSHSRTPDMESYGYSDWTGDDWLYMGLARTAYEFDPDIANQAADWLTTKAPTCSDPWFLTVALVNPHDVMWFPIDQPWYQRAHPEETQRTKQFLSLNAWKGDDPIPPLEADYEEVFDALPENFEDDLFTKPDVHRAWMWEQDHHFYGLLDRSDKKAWLRMLDYYWWQHLQSDANLGRVLEALESSGCQNDTIVIFTSDHGEMCGSHGLRSKGPFIYQENMKVPLYVVAPGITQPGTATSALATHVDLAATIVSLAGADGNGPDGNGADGDGAGGIRGLPLNDVLRTPASRPRDTVLFCQDMAWYRRTVHSRYAIRGYFDGRFKYGRYYGVGGSHDEYGQPSRNPKLFDVDAPFEDHDHELYDLREDPYELVNLANDRGRRQEVRQHFNQLIHLESLEMAAG